MSTNNVLTTADSSSSSPSATTNATFSNATTAAPFIEPVIYEPPDIVYALTGQPRFGHSSDVTAALGSSNDERTSYFVGLMFAGALVLSCFVVWCVLLLVFMCSGKYRVGFCSGRPFHKTAGDEAVTAVVKANKQDAFTKEEEYEQQRVLRAYEYRPCSLSNRPTRARLCFLLAGVAFVTFSVLIVTHGFANLQSTVDVFAAASDQVNKLSVDGLDIIQNGFVRAGQLADKVRDEMYSELGEGSFCPAHPQLDDIPQGQQLRQQALDALAQLDELDAFLDTTIGTIEEALKQARDGSETLSERLEPIDLTDWKALVALIPYSVVPTLLMAGTLMAMFDASFVCYTQALNWVILPVFLILVTIVWVLAAVMIFAAGMNGDFCLPGGRIGDNFDPQSISQGALTATLPPSIANIAINPPDLTILRILSQSGISQDDTVFLVAAYYISQCTNGEDPFAFVKEAKPQLELGSSALAQMNGIFLDSTVMSALSLYCNRDFSNFEVLANNMDTLLTLLLQSITDALDLMACGRIVPIYTATIYEGMCTYSPAAVFWVFCSCLVMAVMGMVMITLRSSYKRTYYTMPKDNDAMLLSNKNIKLTEQEKARNGDDDDEDEQYNGPPPPVKTLNYETVAVMPDQVDDDLTQDDTHFHYDSAYRNDHGAGDMNPIDHNDFDESYYNDHQSYRNSYSQQPQQDAYPRDNGYNDVPNSYSQPQPQQDAVYTPRDNGFDDVQSPQPPQDTDAYDDRYSDPRPIPPRQPEPEDAHVNTYSNQLPPQYQEAWLNGDDIYGAAPASQGISAAYNDPTYYQH